MSVEIWQWYLYRRTVCRRALPNPAHAALVRLERALGARFLLITQNVDGLHLRAGHSLARTYQIHGNIDYMRCAASCTTECWPIPEDFGDVERATALTAAQKDALRCPRCEGGARPHVLWFDESYDEPLFRFESSLRAAAQAALIVSVGTSATTSLPWHIVEIGARAGAGIIDINIASNPFSEIADGLENGLALTATAADSVPAIVEYLCAGRAAP
jgi:NAD-dependent deacetylase